MKKENEHMEFKKSVSLIKEALISISAILNKNQKGTIYFGVNDNGVPIKQTYSPKTLRDIADSISNSIEPRIYPNIFTEMIDGIEVIRVQFEGHQIPYSAAGRYYIRVADEDQVMSSQQLKEFILANKDVRWDSISIINKNNREFSVNKIRFFCNLSSIPFTNIEDILESLGLIKNDKVNNAAVALFGKSPAKVFPNLKLMCSVFASTKTSSILDQKEFEGDIFSLIEEAEKYILKNINIGMEIEGLYRKDIPEIDREALREVIINAFIHRDYFDPDFVSINIFRDRVEIRNPGTLFGQLNIKDILTRHISRRRNEVLADLLSRAHFVERKGRGISLIIDKEPEAKFEQLGGLFIVTLKRNNYKISAESILRLVEGLVENQKKIVMLVHENAQISKREMSDKIGISTTSIDKNLEKLKIMNILEHIGPAKGGRWEIKRENID